MWNGNGVRVFFDGQVFAEQDTKFDDDALKTDLLARGILSNNSDGTASVNFVGFAVTKEHILAFLPKGCTRPNAPVEVQAYARLLLGTLLKYSRRPFSLYPDARNLSRLLNDAEASQFALAKWLVDDFVRHGLYRRKRSRFTTLGDGAIDWNRTIASTPAFLADSGPVYFAHVTREKVFDDAHFVSRLHLTALLLCQQRYGPLLGINLRATEYEPVTPLEIDAAIEIGPVHIRKELRYAYADRTIHLLKTLARIFGSLGLLNTDRLEVFGTNYFEYVWEDICGTVMGNELHEWIDEIPMPIWRSSVSGCEETAATLRPDVVRTFKNNDHSYLLLADAKYYLLHMPSGLRGNPGIGDVTKQLLYEITLTKAADSRGIYFGRNVFVFPTSQEQLISIVGTVHFPVLETSTIGVCYMDVNQAMTRYIRGQVLADAEVAKAISENA